MDDQTIPVGPETGGRVLRFTLDTDLLLSIAGDSLTRGFRSEECATYGIDPCPTFEEMKSR